MIIPDELIMEFIESTPMMESFKTANFKLSKDCRIILNTKEINIPQLIDLTIKTSFES
jgi:hypothetical protein